MKHFYVPFEITNIHEGFRANCAFVYFLFLLATVKSMFVPQQIGLCFMGLLTMVTFKWSFNAVSRKVLLQ